MISVFSAPQQKLSSSLRTLKIRSRLAENTSTAVAASCSQGSPAISAAAMMQAAVEFAFDEGFVVPLPPTKLT